jgi:hypothetical protein
MKPQQKKYEDDDGRVICDMDIDGLPWHDKRVRRENRAARNQVQAGQMTRSEARRYTWYAILAGLLVVSVFSITWILFVLFCTEIWFR